MKTLLATIVALTMLTAAVGPSYGATGVIPDTVLGVLSTNEIVEGKVRWNMVTEPVRMTVDECLSQANEINNNKEIPYVMFCIPEIINHDGEINM